jgi:hypothetical protein
VALFDSDSPTLKVKGLASHSARVQDLLPGFWLIVIGLLLVPVLPPPESPQPVKNILAASNALSNNKKTFFPFFIANSLIIEI